jgi:hypothetical protein
MLGSVEEINTRYRQLWADAVEKYGDEFAVPIEEVRSMQEGHRLEWVEWVKGKKVADANEKRQREGAEEDREAGSEDEGPSPEPEDSTTGEAVRDDQ